MLLKKEKRVISNRQEESYRKIEAHFTLIIKDKDQIIEALEEELGRSKDELSHEKIR